MCLERCVLRLLGAYTVCRNVTLCNKAGTLRLAEAAAADHVPTIVACEVIKLAPVDAPRAGECELTPVELIDCIVTEEGTHPANEIRALVDRTPFLREGYALLKR